MIPALFDSLVICLASSITMMVVKCESTQSIVQSDTNANTANRQQLREADVPTATNNFYDVMENVKRAWKDLPGSGWGKRSWQDLPSSGWGKRGWQDLQTSGWGKRGWQDLQTSGWGKRAWQNLPSSGWGKRARRAYQNSWAVARSRSNFDNIDENTNPMNEESGDNDASAVPDAASDAIAEQDLATLDAVKKAWTSLRGTWGKRDASDWASMKGAWGKRDPAWHNLKGLWGKRSTLADNFYDANSQDSQDFRYLQKTFQNED